MATVPAPSPAQPPRQFKLGKECELRVEVGPDTPLRIRLSAGTAEIYGSELPPDIWLPIPPRSKIAVSSSFFLFKISR
jgi:polyribonucleotide 5'-hydroxyl-kinase